MKKLLLLFGLILSTFIFGQNRYDIKYQEYMDKDISKMKMELILTQLANDKRASVIEASADSYHLQFKIGDIKFKTLISFYDTYMLLKFTDHYLFRDKKWINVADSHEEIKELDQTITDALKSYYYNNL